MPDHDKYKSMGDHDILVEVAVRQEILTDKVDGMCDKVDKHETRITRQESICQEARKTIFNEVNHLREGNPGNNGRRSKSRKEQATIGGGTIMLLGSVIYAIGKGAGWW